MERSEKGSYAGPFLTLGMADHGQPGEQVWCPLCENPIETEVGTPSVPSQILSESELRVTVGDKVPVYGWRCLRHRSHKMQVLAPADLAPESYESVDAVVAGQSVKIAIPQPILEEGELR